MISIQKTDRIAFVLISFTLIGLMSLILGCAPDDGPYTEFSNAARPSAMESAEPQLDDLDDLDDRPEMKTDVDELQDDLDPEDYVTISILYEPESDNQVGIYLGSILDQDARINANSDEEIKLLVAEYVAWALTTDNSKIGVLIDADGEIKTRRMLVVQSGVKLSPAFSGNSYRLIAEVRTDAAESQTDDRP